jgi:MFS family permease
MIETIKNYSKLDRSTLNMIKAAFFIQLINASFLQILLIYMAKCGYHDSESANFISYRFLGVLLLSLPLGIFIRGKRIKPLFFISSIATPILSILIVLAIDSHQYLSLYVLQFLWGLSFACMQVCSLPYILRNTSIQLRMEAISLSLSTWSLGCIIGGLLIFSLARIWPAFFDEKTILILISSLGFLSFLFFMGIQEDSVGEKKEKQETKLTVGDGKILFKAAFPTILLAVGAGLTIPFVGLFFYHVHGFDSDSFAFLSSFTTIIVFMSFMVVPWIKKKIGVKKAILVSQGIAIFFLINLALTQLYNTYIISTFIAGLCYMARQPLMNMASPLTTDVTMAFVGEKNHEIMSALNAAIWSGSWFISSKIFLYLRKAELEYVWVFLITAIIYIISVLTFYFIILRSERINR